MGLCSLKGSEPLETPGAVEELAFLLQPPMGEHFTLSSGCAPQTPLLGSSQAEPAELLQVS